LELKADRKMTSVPGTLSALVNLDWSLWTSTPISSNHVQCHRVVCT